MSIVELLVSLTLFSLVVGSLVTLIATGLQVARSNKDRSVAAHLASQEMDALRQQPFGSMTIGQTSHTTSVNVQTPTQTVTAPSRTATVTVPAQPVGVEAGRPAEPA